LKYRIKTPNHSNTSQKPVTRPRVTRPRVTTPHVTTPHHIALPVIGERSRTD
jgi:hypothetical protein